MPTTLSRFRTSLVSDMDSYARNDVAAVESVAASGYFNQNIAMREIHSDAAGLITAAMVGAGYTNLAVDPSGAVASTPAVPGAVFHVDGSHFRVVTPERRVETFVIKLVG